MAASALLIDVIAIVVYVLAANPDLTGVAVHEWLGIVLVAAIIAHCVANYTRAADVCAGIRKEASAWRAGAIALDIALLLSFVTVTVSGVFISGAVLPALGLYAPGYYVWNPLHAVSAKIFLVVLILHVLLHAKWIAAMWFKRKKPCSDCER